MGLKAINQLFEVDLFLFRRSPEAFNEDFGHATHGDTHPSLCPRRGPSAARELVALIGVHNSGRAEPGDGLVQGFDVDAPELVRAVDLHAYRQLRTNRVLRVRLAGARALVDRL